VTVLTLNDVFIHYADSALDTGNNFQAVSAERATAPRLATQSADNPSQVITKK
jgi:hypothetical protein